MAFKVKGVRTNFLGQKNMKYGTLTIKKKKPKAKTIAKTKVRNFLNSVEKKQISVYNTGMDFGQLVNQWNAVNITPQIIQGVGEAQRVGQKCVLTGATFDLQVSSQSAAVSAIKYKYYIITQHESSIIKTTSVVVPQFLDPNIFSVTNAIDWHSQRRTEFMKEYKVLASGSGTLAPDSITGQISINQKRRYLKLNLPQRYLSDGSVDTIINQMYCIFVADSGDTTAFTGAVAKLSFRYWYVDN